MAAPPATCCFRKHDRGRHLTLPASILPLHWDDGSSPARTFMAHATPSASRLHRLGWRSGSRSGSAVTPTRRKDRSMPSLQALHPRLLGSAVVAALVFAALPFEWTVN